MVRTVTLPYFMTFYCHRLTCFELDLEGKKTPFVLECFGMRKILSYYLVLSLVECCCVCLYSCSYDVSNSVNSSEEIIKNSLLQNTNLFGFHFRGW